MFATSVRLGAVAAALLGSTAAAQTPGVESYRLPGVYDYVSAAKAPDGRPACTERWTLAANGDFRLESGQEVIEGAWRKVSQTSDAIGLALTGLTTNGLPDCRGARATGAVADFGVEVSPDATGALVLGSWEHPGPGQPWIRRVSATLTPVLDPAARARP